MRGYMYRPRAVYTAGTATVYQYYWLLRVSTVEARTSIRSRIYTRTYSTIYAVRVPFGQLSSRYVSVRFVAVPHHGPPRAR